MNHVEGSAVEIFCEVPIDKVDDTTLTLESLLDSDGTDYASSNALTFSTAAGQTNIASVVWQSTEGTHKVGKYIFVVKSKNGTRENFEKGNFYLTED